MDASLISQMKAIEDENRGLKRMYGDFNREGMDIEVGFSLSADRVIGSVDRIIEWRG